MIELQNIATQVPAANWEEALQAAGQLLVNAGSCTEAYVSATIDAVKELGPYIVLAPHVALGHSRPSPEVLRSDIALAIPQTPVNFGVGDKDPVKLVFSFCATDNDSHLELLGKLADILGSPEQIEALAQAQTPQEVLNLIKES